MSDHHIVLAMDRSTAWLDGVVLVGPLNSKQLVPGDSLVLSATLNGPINNDSIDALLGFIVQKQTMNYFTAKVRESLPRVFDHELSAELYYWVMPRKPALDLSRYPHKCPRCGARAYVGCGPADVDCSAKCNRVTTALRAS